MIENRDRRRCGNRGDESGHNGLAGAVSVDAHDAPRAVRRLPRQAQPAIEIPVERHAVRQEVLDAGARLARENMGDAGVGEPRSRRDRVGRVGLRAVALANRSGDATLRPGGRRAFAERLRRQHGDRKRRKPERRKQPGQSSADDKNAVRSARTAELQRFFNAQFAHNHPLLSKTRQAVRSIIRSTARRARTATSGSTVTFSFS